MLNVKLFDNKKQKGYLLKLTQETVNMLMNTKELIITKGNTASLHDRNYYDYTMIYL